MTSTPTVPRQLSAKVPVVDFALHPQTKVAALGLVNGKIKFYKYDIESERMQKVIRPLSVSAACRCVSFSPNEGLQFYGGFESGDIIVGDTASGAISSKIGSSGETKPAALYVIKPFGNNMIFTGDDLGYVKLYDIRTASSKPVVQFANVFEDEDEDDGTAISTDDWVSDIFVLDEGGHKILVSRSDGTICTYSTRRGGRHVLRSESLNAELTGMAGPLRAGKKFAVAANDGALNIFNYGDFGNISDRFPISKSGKLKSASGRRSLPISVDSICQLNDSLVFVGCGDGKIRLVSIQPSAVLAVVGIHEEDYPVEHLRMSDDGSLIASSCYDGTVRFWATEPYQNVSLAGLSENESDESSGDSDDGPKRQPRLKKRKKDIKRKLSHRHNFFADLDANPMEHDDDDDEDEDSDNSEVSSDSEVSTEDSDSDN